MDKTINEKTKITLDSGENRVFMTKLLKTMSPESVIAPTASGALGYATALVTKLVYPDHEVVAVCSDGGFPMTMNALINCSSIQH
ncbi:thiamine pyrophosphate-dependent enzyme [Oceanobacillus sp. CF4.6]|uniref:thiamine pyrophosphate-dependent enzyme n=1 Tax=Oceanobacillus sp. CF4.6 TaxID=3373080 RepID=UPI003EE480DD